MRKATRAMLILAVLSALAGPVPAEVSASKRGGDDRLSTLLMDLMSITDGADPIPYVGWEAYRVVPDNWLLNPDGVLRPDGRPDLVFSPGTRWPIVVWAYKNATDHDIVFSRWDDDGWIAPEYLTSSLEDERDPRVFVTEDGTVYVVWWVDNASSPVMLLTRDSDAALWAAPVSVTPVGELGRRPTVALSGNKLRVAYERDSNTGVSSQSQIVVVRLNNSGSWIEEQVFTVDSTEPLDPILHVGPGGVWIDWNDGNGEFSYSELGAGNSWGVVKQQALADDSWVGIEGVRLEIGKKLGAFKATQGQFPIDP